MEMTVTTLIGCERGYRDNTTKSPKEIASPM